MRFAGASRFVLFGLVFFVAQVAAAQTTGSWNTAGDIKTGSRGSVTGSVTDISETRSEFALISDDELAETPIRVRADALVTTYRGFGSVAGEILRGTPGFAQIREGDRIQVRGLGGENRTITAEDVLLVGRTVATPDSVIDERLAIRTMEGTVRSVGRDNRIVMETAQRRIETVIASASTPVRYRGVDYRVVNLEPGDRIRVNVSRTTADGMTASSIEVLENATDVDPAGRRTLGSVSGRVIRIDTRLETFRIRGERNREIRVDARNAADATGVRYRLSNLRIGETVDVSGEWDGTDSFRADTIRLFSRGDDPFGDEEAEMIGGAVYDIVTISGRVDSVHRNGVLLIEDTVERRNYPVLVAENFIVELRNRTYASVDRLRAGDRVSITAFRDSSGRLIAQVIRGR